MREIKQDCQRQSTHYEWVIEMIDVHGDIIDCHYFDTLGEAIDFSKNVSESDYPDEHFFARIDWGLVRSTGCEAEGLEERQYAYVRFGKLPERMDGGSKVPKRFHEMLSKHIQ